MEILLFLLIAGLLTAPFVAAWPRPAQRRRERRRQRLLDAGVKLRFTENGAVLWCSLPRRQGGASRPIDAFHAARAPDGWALQGQMETSAHRQLMRCAEEMPPSVDEIAIGESEVAARWREGESEPDPQAIAQGLRAILKAADGSAP